jgi:DNA-binding FadR family transcriptional regulator
MSRNKVLLKQLRQIFEHIYLRYRVERMHPVRLTISSEEHKELDEMIRNKEREGAERMIRLHIRTAKEMMISGMMKEEEIPQLSMPGV